MIGRAWFVVGAMRIAIALHVLAAPAAAAGVVGTGNTDSCSESALVDALVGGGDVTFNCGGAPWAITLTSHKTIAVNTTIDGGGLITLGGGNAVRHFVVNTGATLTLNNITLSNGYSGNDFGGSILVDGGRLVLNNSTIQNSQTNNYGGGGIYSTGPVTVNNSTVQGNRGQDGAGLSTVALTMVNSTVSDNVATNYGGGLQVGGVTTISNSQVSNNTASSGGGIFVTAEGQLTMRNVNVAGNTANGVSGEIPSGGGGIANQGTLAANNVTLDGNMTTKFGGALFNDGVTATLAAGSRVTGNMASIYTGGIVNWSGPLFLTDVVVSGNQSQLDVGLFNRVGAQATLSRVSVTENVATNANGADGVFNAGTLSVTNTTISGNLGGRAGFLNANGAATFLNTTLSGNSGGVYHFSGGAVLAFKNSIIANSVSQPNCVVQAGSATGIASTGFNLSDDTSCSAYFTMGGDRNNTPDGLGPLADNGGPGQTHLPLPDSVALDNGTNSGCPSVDQRGQPRPIGLACDIGAVEVQAGELSTPTPTATVTSTPTVPAASTPTGAATDTPTSTLTPSSTPNATNTATQSVTPSPTTTETGTARPTETPTPTGTSTSTLTPTSPATATETRTPTDVETATRTPAETASPTEPPTACVGDCGGDDEVTVEEIITMVNIALGTVDVSRCPPGDPGGDGEITVDEIVGAVTQALSGCPRG
jgi:hypothetical protein